MEMMQNTLHHRLSVNIGPVSHSVTSRWFLCAEVWRNELFFILIALLQLHKASPRLYLWLSEQYCVVLSTVSSTANSQNVCTHHFLVHHSWGRGQKIAAGQRSCWKAAGANHWAPGGEEGQTMWIHGIIMYTYT